MASFGRPSSWPCRSAVPASAQRTTPSLRTLAQGPPSNALPPNVACAALRRRQGRRCPAPAVRQAGRRGLRFVIYAFSTTAATSLTNRSTYKALIVIFDQLRMKRRQVVVKSQTRRTASITRPTPTPPTTVEMALAIRFRSPRPACQATTANAHRRAAANRLRVGRPGGHAHARPIGEAERPPRNSCRTRSTTGDENVHSAVRARRGPVRRASTPGRAPEADSEALTVDDFACDGADGQRSMPACGHRPISCFRIPRLRRQRSRWPASACAECPFPEAMSIKSTRDGQFHVGGIHRQDPAWRCVAWKRRRRSFAIVIAPRSGIASTTVA